MSQYLKFDIEGFSSTGQVLSLLSRDYQFEFH
jgi:hypothetical protein